jgi:hypothetical protein
MYIVNAQEVIETCNNLISIQKQKGKQFKKSELEWICEKLIRIVKSNNFTDNKDC